MAEQDTLTAELAYYEAAVRAATTDLPANVGESMIEDLRAHATELAADEPDVTLSEALGSPSAFAEEYRAASNAGDVRQPPPAGARHVTGWRRWLFPFGLLCYVAGIGVFTVALVNTGNEGYQLPGAALVLTGVLLAVSWRRGWTAPAGFDRRGWPAPARAAYVAIWALRGWGLVVFADAYVIGGDYPYPQLTGFPLPQYFGLGLGVFDGGGAGGLIVILAVAALSIWLGRGEHRLGKWQALVFPVDLVLAAAPVLAAISVLLNGV
ncbi:hypothetical protein [Flindersiella endophytica]